MGTGIPFRARWCAKRGDAGKAGGIRVEWKLNDAEAADLLTYIRASFGNDADPVKASKVADVRKSLRDENGG